MKAYGSGCIDSHFLDLGTCWRWVVNFTHWPLYPRGKSPFYPLDRRLGGPQSQSGRSWEEKILDPTGTIAKHSLSLAILQRSGHSLVTLPSYQFTTTLQSIIANSVAKPEISAPERFRTLLSSLHLAILLCELFRSKNWIFEVNLKMKCFTTIFTSLTVLTNLSVWIVLNAWVGTAVLILQKIHKAPQDSCIA
jgi:hypothetical protein